MGPPVNTDGDQAFAAVDAAVAAMLQWGRR